MSYAAHMAGDCTGSPDTCTPCANECAACGNWLHECECPQLPIDHEDGLA